MSNELFKTEDIQLIKRALILYVYQISRAEKRSEELQKSEAQSLTIISRINRNQRGK